jgi:hypothetical protein
MCTTADSMSPKRFDCHVALLSPDYFSTINGDANSRRIRQSCLPSANPLLQRKRALVNGVHHLQPRR